MKSQLAINRSWFDFLPSNSPHTCHIDLPPMERRIGLCFAQLFKGSCDVCIMCATFFHLACTYLFYPPNFVWCINQPIELTARRVRRNITTICYQHRNAGDETLIEKMSTTTTPERRSWFREIDPRLWRSANSCVCSKHLPRVWVIVHARIYFVCERENVCVRLYLQV